eukprot:jgi/Bigna1/79070/fgenesh1_pg.59_\
MQTKTQHTKSKTPRMRCQRSEKEEKEIESRIPQCIKAQLKRLKEEAKDNGGKMELQKVERPKKKARTTVKDGDRRIIDLTDEQDEEKGEESLKTRLKNLLEKLEEFSETVKKEYLHFRDQHKTPFADKNKCHAEWELFKNDLEFVSMRLWNFSYVRFPLYKAMKRVLHRVNRTYNQISSDSFQRKVIRELNDVKKSHKFFRKGGDLPETLKMLKEHMDEMKEAYEYDLEQASIDRHESFLGIFEELCNIVFEVSVDLSDTFNDMTSEQILKISDVVKNIYLELNKSYKWNDGDGPDGESDSNDSDDSGSEYVHFCDTDDTDNECDDVKQ